MNKDTEIRDSHFPTRCQGAPKCHSQATLVHVLSTLTSQGVSIKAYRYYCLKHSLYHAGQRTDRAKRVMA